METLACRCSEHTQCAARCALLFTCTIPSRLTPAIASHRHCVGSDLSTCESDLIDHDQHGCSDPAADLLHLVWCSKSAVGDMGRRVSVPSCRTSFLRRQDSTEAQDGLKGVKQAEVDVRAGPVFRRLCATRLHVSTARPGLIDGVMSWGGPGEVEGGVVAALQPVARGHHRGVGRGPPRGGLVGHPGPLRRLLRGLRPQHAPARAARLQQQQRRRESLCQSGTGALAHPAASAVDRWQRW